MIAKSKRLEHVKEYYFSIKLSEVRRLKSEGKPVINIGIGSPDLDPPLAVSRAMKNAMEQNHIHGYQSYQGLPELRNTIADFYKKYYRVSIDPEQEILPLMGSKEGIMHISLAFLNSGDKVLIPNPGYPTYSSVTKLVGAVPVYYDLTEKSNWFPDLETLEKTDLSKIKIMWVNYPHMPTGSKPTKDLFEQLVLFAKKNQILLINDNPYSFILNNEPMSILEIDDAKEVAIELNSLSKTFNMAGWRIGMVLGSFKNIEAILQVKSNMDSGMFFGIQQGAIAALQSDINWFANLNAIYEKRRKIAWKIADTLNCTYDKNSAGLFVWANLPEGKISTKVTDELLYKHDIFLAPGTIFGTNGEGYIRISLCVTEDILKEVLSRILNN